MDENRYPVVNNFSVELKSNDSYYALLVANLNAYISLALLSVLSLCLIINENSLIGIIICKCNSNSIHDSFAVSD